VASLAFLVPGRLDTPTGGFRYDRRIVRGLRARGWNVAVVELDDSFPCPTPAARADASRALAGVPDGEIVLVDGLAFGALPEEVSAHAGRLLLAALVHHPLAAETGLDPAVERQLEASERLALGSARLVIVTSEPTARLLGAYGVGRDRIAVVEPGIDRAPLAVRSDDGVTRFLCVASVVPRKGHDVLVRALAAVRDLPWHATFVGSLDRDRETAARVRALVDEGGLAGRIALAGEAGEEGVAAYYAAADVFVLPTLYEGYGMVVAEAVARGLPVVATPTGGIPALLEGGGGVLVPGGDPDALAAALRRILEDQGYRARLAAQARAARDRLQTWETAVDRMAEALRRLAGAP
jgi:glycosyltransferase involved in cell wall biosynthesis